MHITIPGPPRTKKNSSQIVKLHGRHCVIPSKAYKAYEKEALWHIPKRREPMHGPVNVQCVYYMPTRRRVDLCNLLEATCDILVKGGILQDDNSGVVASHDGSRVAYDKLRPRVEITITDSEEAT